MEPFVAAIALHGYSILFLVVLAESVGLPVPAALGLLVAGAASARGAMDPGQALATAGGAMLAGDNLLFLLGRYTGWWLLGTLCRFTLNPEACILGSAEAFYRRGRVVLVFAKFLPGVNTMAPPLAGSMNMPFRQFFPLDFAGASLYILTYFGAGYLFSDFLNAMMRGYSVVGGVVGWILAGLFAIWLGNRARIWLKYRGETPVPMIEPHEVAGRPGGFAVFDVRSHGYYESGTQRILGSARLEPNALSDQIGRLPHDREIVLYCTCLREATAVRVARMLAEKGIPSAVLRGGLSAWKKADLPLEPVPDDEIVFLPKFA
jgi:membrane protein DedA with SNARE-associated domain/rhodanese-related sulfurtransferase